MNRTIPAIPDAEPGKFAFAVGKALQNFGTIEYLVNEILDKIVCNAIIQSEIARMGISKRLDILENFVKRDWAKVQAANAITMDSFAKAKAAFRNRNKIAHNPLVIKAHHLPDGDKLDIGIHVIRYAESGSSEEWLHLNQIEKFVTDSQPLMQSFNTLLGFYQSQVPPSMTNAD